MFTGNIVQEKRWVIPSNGSTQNPGLSFFSGRSSGFSCIGSNVVVSMQGIQLADMSTQQLTVFGNVTGNLVGNGSGITKNPLISNIQIANSSYVVQDDTAVSTENTGYVIINGSHFGPGTSVTVGGTQASAVTFVSPSLLKVQLPAKAAGSYALEATRADGMVATVPMGVTYSPFPVWSTSATLPQVAKTVDFSQTLSAPESSGSTVTYIVANGSSLPPGTTLVSNGVLSGKIVIDPGITTTYSFSVDAIDAQFQNIPRTFGLTAVVPIVIATGGAVTTSGAYTIHTFTASGTFTVTQNPLNKPFEVLVVAGGGGGGSPYFNIPGGGGAGGVLYVTGFTVSAGTYAITIGGGGAVSTNGSDSVFSTLTAVGGGFGRSDTVVPADNIITTAWGSGGSGGGNRSRTQADTINVLAAGTPGQGNNGGMGDNTCSEIRWVGGGGGGAGAVGGDAVRCTKGGDGGVGRSLSISGVSVYYGGGGGGGGYSTNVSPGSGGLGGGGRGGGGTQVEGLPGSANTGGGGGGGGSQLSQPAGIGGSGIFICRYIA